MQRVAWTDERLDAGFDRVDNDIRELRGEMNSGFAGLRQEMEAGDSELRGEMRAGFADLRQEMEAGDSELRGEMRAGFADLRREMKAGDAELRGEMQGGFAELRGEIASVRTLMWRMTAGIVISVVATSLLHGI